MRYSWIFIIFFALSGVSRASGLVPEVVSLPQKCPDKVDDVRKWVAGLDQSTQISEIYALGTFFKGCQNQAASKVALAQAGPAVRRLQEIAEGGVETPESIRRILELQVRRAVPEGAHRLPGFFRNPQFWENFASPEGGRQEAALTGIATHIPGARVFRYVSRLQPELPLHLAYFKEPKTGYERFVHFDSELNINLLTIVPGGKKGKPVFLLETLARADWVDSKAGLRPDRLKARLQSQQGRCYRCHQVPVISVHPIEPSEVRSYTPGITGVALLEDFNNRWIKSDSTGMTNIMKGAPPLGPVKEKRDLEWMKKCSGVSEPERLKLVTASMNCAQCHDEKFMPAVKVPIGVQADFLKQIELSRKFEDGVGESYHPHVAVFDVQIQSGNMPPDLGRLLTPDERLGLSRCLLDENLGRFSASVGGRGLTPPGSKGAWLDSLQ